MSRFWHTLAVVSVVLIAHAMSLASALAEKRVALVIGNGKYENANPLKNPANDAADIANALEKVGFDVIVGTDTSYDEMRKLVQRFSKAVANADVATFYYAGHGMQVSGENYLVPVNAKLDDKNDLDFQTVSLRLIQRQMEQSAATRLIFLDACRDNPLTRSWSSASRSTAGKGLASPVGSTKGTYIAFATEPGNVALDGDGARNSPFTTALLNHIHSPGVELASLMKRVRRDVTIATRDKQIPWSNSGLIGDFYFNTDKSSQENQSLLAFQQEQTAWLAIKDGAKPSDIEKFLARFPNGILSTIARDRLKFLRERSQTELLTPKSVTPKSRSPRPVNECDRLASSSLDSDAIHYSPGQQGPLLETAKAAVAACKEALAQNPDDATLIYQLGFSLYMVGDKTSAFRHVKQAADQGYPAAAIFVATMLDYGDGVPKDVKQAVKYFKIASDKGDMSASWNLAWRNEFGIDQKKNAKLAKAYWVKAFKSAQSHADKFGRAEDFFYLSRLYGLGNGTLKNVSHSQENFRKAEEIYSEAAARNSVPALLSLASLYQDHPSGTKSKRAHEYLRKAVKLGSKSAEKALASFIKQHPKFKLPSDAVTLDSAAIDSFSGTWLGNGKQNNDVNWALRLEIVKDQRSFFARYVGYNFQCSSVLKVQEVKGSKMVLSEKMTTGSCYSGCSVTLIKLNNGKTALQKSCPNGKIHATATLSR